MFSLIVERYLPTLAVTARAGNRIGEIVEEWVDQPFRKKTGKPLGLAFLMVAMPAKNSCLVALG